MNKNMSTAIPEFSVVVPVYNSKNSLKELHDGICNIFNKLGRTFELIFVDDASVDESFAVLQEIKSTSRQKIKIIQLAKNFGQHNATLCGIHFASSEVIITIDDDLQTPPYEIEKLIQLYDNQSYDVIYGIAGSNKKHSYFRNLGSRWIKSCSRILRNTPGEGSSFRLISARITEKLKQTRSFFIFIDEVLLWYTDRIGFIEVEHLPRKYNQSGYSFRKLWILLANLIIFYTDAPLKLMVYGGIFASFISFILGIVFIIKKLFFNVPLGYTSLIVAILFSTSIILFSLGIIGEYLSRIYKVQNQKPPYAVNKVVE